MWKLIKISAKNLCAFKQLDYEIQQKRTTLIFGNNLDNDSQASNGSGKSALIEAIAIALTGSPLRKVNTDEIINDSEDTSIVSAVLTNDTSNQQLTIHRQLSRKQPQVIRIISQTGPLDTDTEEIVQPSVADYNKYILDEIGLSKEDIYANFILSKHKFTSFLSSSDKEKKEIINRFSNGILVDESLSMLVEDMSPIQDKLKDAESKSAIASGKVAAINEQIATELAESIEKSQNKTKRIEDLKNKIANKREFIRTQNDIINKNDDRLNIIENIDTILQDMEKSDTTVMEAKTKINTLFAENNLAGLSDYEAKINSLNEKIQTLNSKYKESENKVKAKEKELAQIKESLESVKSELEQFEVTYSSEYSQLKKEIQQLSELIESSQKEQVISQRKRQEIERNLASLQAQLAGVIQCPKCSHEFTLSNNIDIESVRQKVSDTQTNLDAIVKLVDEQEKHINALTSQKQTKGIECNTLDDKRTSLSAQVNNIQTSVNKTSAEVQKANAEMSAVCDSINKTQKEIDNIRRTLFDEVYDIIDEAIKNCETESQNAKINCQNAEGTIQSYEESIKEIEESSATELIENLQASKSRYEQELNQAIAHQEEVSAQLLSYKAQESAFVEFKTHLANTKIGDLGRITNEFLERIGSDIRISFSGYTVLKSGKIRDKISISLIRDGIDCGSFDKFSEGEKARVNLANILALNKLTNVNCIEGKGLDLLILDEILDATDESGLANIFEALNSLQVTSLVVSHGNIAENYPHKLIVNKQNGVSFI